MRWNLIDPPAIVKRALAGSLIVSLAVSSATPARAQPRRVDAGVDAGPSATSLVDLSRAGSDPVLRIARHVQFEANVTERLPVRRGQCYALLGAATGVSQVTAQVMFRGTEITPLVALASSRGAAARQRFCVEEAAEAYRVDVHAEGPSSWDVAVVPVEGAAPGPAQPPTAAAADAGVADVAGPPVVAFAPHAPGGDGHDYVSAQVRAWAAAHPGARAVTDLIRDDLRTNAFHEMRLALESGRCVSVVAAGVPSVADMSLTLDDPSGHRVVEDATHRGTESVRWCAPYSGPHLLRVRMFSGFGRVGVQVFADR